MEEELIVEALYAVRVGADFFVLFLFFFFFKAQLGKFFDYAQSR
jgi:hypothetical protein